MSEKGSGKGWGVDEVMRVIVFIFLLTDGMFNDWRFTKEIATNMMYGVNVLLRAFTN